MTAQPWEQYSNRSGEYPAQNAPQPVAEPEQEPMDAATRMSGLRNLIFSLGLKNAHHPAETSEAAADFAPPAEPVRPRPAYARPMPPVQHDSAWDESAGASPTLVTAPPEFLPPKPLVENTGKEHHRSGNGASRRDRRDTYDDVEILPSWRGQYKRG